MLVTGGLGGLGLIASFHCATEFENPIITTSRSGRLPPSAGPQGMNIYEAIREVVPIYNVKLDVGNSQALADLFAWLGLRAWRTTVVAERLESDPGLSFEGIGKIRVDSTCGCQGFLSERRLTMSFCGPRAPPDVRWHLVVCGGSAGSTFPRGHRAARPEIGHTFGQAGCGTNDRAVGELGNPSRLSVRWFPGSLARGLASDHSTEAGEGGLV